MILIFLSELLSAAARHFKSVHRSYKLSARLTLSAFCGFWTQKIKFGQTPLQFLQ